MAEGLSIGARLLKQFFQLLSGNYLFCKEHRVDFPALLPTFGN